MYSRRVFGIGLVSLICFLQLNIVAAYPQYENVYVNDWADLLTPEAERRITQQLKALKANSDVEVTFVSIERMSDYANTRQSIEGFALDLFNHWGVGNAQRNDGVLVLVSRFDRKMRIATGRAYDHTNKNAVAKDIIDDYFVPNFKRDEYQKGILEGMQRVVQAFDPNASIAAGFAANTKQKMSNLVSSAWYELKNSEILIFLFFVTGIVLLNLFKKLFAGLSQREVKASYDLNANYLIDTQPTHFKQTFPDEKKVDTRKIIAGYVISLIVVSFLSLFIGFNFWLLTVLAVSVIVILNYLVVRILMARRNTAKACPRCSNAMRRLAELKDDEYLQLPEKVEESLHSVDYDVWLCGDCQRTKKLAYPYWQSSISHCAQCEYKTLETDVNTLKTATTSREGLEEVIEDCKYCDYHHEYEQVIPKKSETRSGSSSGGGSFGGGSSSGGGASGSW